MTTPLDLSVVIRRSSRAIWRAFDTETAIIDPQATALRTIQGVGSRFWELADGRTLGEILEILLNEYDVDRIQLETDIGVFLSELQTRGLLDQTEVGSR